MDIPFFLTKLRPLTVTKPGLKYLKIDLSIQNRDLLELRNAQDFEHYINRLLTESGADAAYGGYLEHRNLYQRSTIFNSETTRRDIHIGLDIWMPAGAAIFAPMAGTVHSFQNNLGLGNYGPTLILQHQFENEVFYTLYGHLTVHSIANYTVGQSIVAGSKLAELGDSTVNGDYAPHLHFQIIRDIGEHLGDYPGVCSKNELTFYQNNCPDPGLLLGLT